MPPRRPTVVRMPVSGLVKDYGIPRGSGRWPDTRNSTHGDRLSRFDQARCVLLAEGMGIDPGRVAAALGLTVAAVGELRATKTATDSEGHR